MTAVDNSDLKCRFKIALLGWREILIDDDQIRVKVAERCLNLFDLATADQCRGSDASELLPKLVDDLSPGGLRQPFKLVQAVLDIKRAIMRRQLDTNQNGVFSTAPQMRVALLQDSKA